MRKRDMLLIMVVLLSSIAIAAYIYKCSSDKKEIEKQFSNKILIGVESHGGYGLEEDFLPHEIRVYKNKRVEYLIDNKVKNSTTISDSAYKEIENGLNLSSLYYTICKSEEGVMDGYSKSVIIYGRDNLPLKEIGCYMPINDNINDAYSLVANNVPKDLFN